MTLSNLRLALVAGVVAPFALATASFAQPAPQPGPPAAEEHRRHDPAEMRAHMAEHLRAALQLQPSQDGALNAFLDALKPPGDKMDRARGEHGADRQLATPARLDKMLARMDERRARFAQMAGATKQFYAALTPSQQKAFDAMHAGGMHGGHGGMGGRWGGRDGGQDGDRGGPHEMGPDGQSPG
jgi:Spy/CpxP family protein refolding chaperone